ncbi:hypothetical protein TRVL_08635 [Trypanosoma vivax]|nr:hypothetical protein TRVL_08635 [Trypanosoma vivax]
MATHRQHRGRQRPRRIYRPHSVPARLARGRRLRHILLPPTQRRVSTHLPPPANQRTPLPFILGLLNHPVQLRRLRHPKGRCHGLALGDCLLCGHPDASCHCLVQRIRALGRPLHSSEYLLVTQFSKLVPPRLVPRVRCMSAFGGSNHVQAGAHERIERDPIVIAVRAQCGPLVRDLAASIQRDVRWRESCCARLSSGGRSGVDKAQVALYAPAGYALSLAVARA